jgi:TPP-dependent pyruvate/acetoin dehydrogenase alpha subunit
MTDLSSLPSSATWSQVERDTFTDSFRTMLRIRRFEETVQQLFMKGEVYGTTHLCIGHEAVSAGVAAMLGPNDRVAATYRGHGHALALGISFESLLAEMLGRATGINGGRSGSMNVTSIRHRLIGSFGIVGGSIGAAVGAALALRNTGNIAVAFFGDGATNQAYFFECLNFAHVFELPVVFVCENNLYGEYTLTESVSGGDICSRSVALGVPAQQIDGMAVWEVARAAQEAMELAREGGGPTLIEALTYRFVGHSRSDPAKYRRPGELESWKLRDPIDLCRERLQQEGVPAESLDAITEAVEHEVASATAAGLAAPWPDPDDVPSEFAPSR